MSLVAIRAALEVQLNAMTPALPTAFENANFTPPAAGAPYQAVNLLPAEPDNNVFGPNFQQRGLLQVTLSYPQAAGPAAAAARAELIRAQFPRGLSVTAGGITATIEKTPEVGPALIVDARYQLPVRVRFYANVPS